MTASTRRLFVALRPDDDVRAALARARDRWTWASGARPTPVANLHITLVFLGAVPATDVSDLIAALPVSYEPFALRLGRHALWSNGVAVLEPPDACRALAALQADIAERTAALGFAPETRRYRPHVTLGRDARGSTPPARRRSDRVAHRRVRTDRVAWRSLPDGRSLAALRTE